MSSTTVLWKVDECSVYEGTMRLSGWCFAPLQPIVQVEVQFADDSRVALRSYGMKSPDVARSVDERAGNCRFDERVPVPDRHAGADCALVLHFADGSTKTSTSVQANAREGDAAHRSWFDFLNRLGELSEGNVLELGSRARSGITRRHLIPPHLRYVGVDVRAGENVDVVGDAHRLSALVPQGSVSAVFALSVFEHLAMPWKVVVEMNRILRPAGLVFIQTPQTWPLHDEPCDFWRFSAAAWPSLFNASTGFEIIGTAQGEPAQVVPRWDAAALHGLPAQPAYLNSTVLARKVSDPQVDWAVPADVFHAVPYPH